MSARSRVRINWTDSLPRGLYLVDAVPKDGVVHGQIVVACPPRSYAEIGRDHGYLISAGCPGGVAPVLELVAARASDVAQLSSAGIEVNGSQLPGTSLLTADKRGDPPGAGCIRDISCAGCRDLAVYSEAQSIRLTLLQARADGERVERCKAAAHVAVAYNRRRRRRLGQIYLRKSAERKVAPWGALKSSRRSGRFVLLRGAVRTDLTGREQKRPR